MARLKPYRVTVNLAGAAAGAKVLIDPESPDMQPLLGENPILVPWRETDAKPRRRSPEDAPVRPQEAAGDAAAAGEGDASSEAPEDVSGAESLPFEE